MGIVIAVSPKEILSTSKIDLDKALEMFRDYVKTHPEDLKTIESLGGLLYAKRALRNWTLSEYVLKEDLEGLLDALRSSDVEIDEKTLKLLRLVFRYFDDRIKERIEELDPVFLSSCEKFIPFLNLNAENFAENLVKAYTTGVVPESFESLSKLRCVSNMKDVRKALKDAINDLIEKGEGYYMKAYNVIRVLGLDPKEFSRLEMYADLYLKLNSIDPESVDLEDYQKLLEEFRSIKIEKNILKERLATIAPSLSKRGHDLSKLCGDPKLCPKLAEIDENSTVESSNRAKLILVSSIGAVLLALIFLRLNNPRVRLKRLKRKLSKNPLNANLHLKIARLYEKLDMVEEAMREYKIASDLIDSGTDQP